MSDAPEPASPRRRTPPRLVPRIGDLLDTGEELIAFVEKYQKVWEAESRAMLAMGEFLAARAEATRLQAELMRMGNDTFRRYVQWSEALLSLRPDAIVQAFLNPEPGRRRQPRTGAPE